MTDQTLLVRMDSGNDAVENDAVLHWDDSRVKFLVKHNFRRENRDEMAAELRKVCKNISYPREGKTVYIGSTWRTVHTKEKGDITIRMVYEIIDRTITANGQEMLFPDTEFNLYYTSLPDSDEDIIELYHNHATCEQFHSEIKTDMDMERMPSGKFDTNALILKLSMIAYNVLRIIGTEAMKKNDMPVRHKTIKRRRIRIVIDRLMLIAGHLTVHARKVLLATWEKQFLGEYLYQNMECAVRSLIFLSSDLLTGFLYPFYSDYRLFTCILIPLLLRDNRSGCVAVFRVEFCGFRIQLNANAFRDEKKLAEEYQKLVDEGWFVKGTTYHSIVIHEMGHMYANVHKIDGFEVAKDILNMNDASTNLYLLSNLSEYASQLKAEVIAEVFSSYYGGQPNQFEKDFIKYIHERM